MRQTLVESLAVSTVWVLPPAVERMRARCPTCQYRVSPSLSLYCRVCFWAAPAADSSCAGAQMSRKAVKMNAAIPRDRVRGIGRCPNEAVGSCCTRFAASAEELARERAPRLGFGGLHRE